MLSFQVEMVILNNSVFFLKGSSPTTFQLSSPTNLQRNVAKRNYGGVWEQLVFQA